MTDETHLSQTSSWQRFTFLSKSYKAESDLTVQADLAAPGQIEQSIEPAFPLSQARVGDRVCITQLQRSNTEAELINTGIAVGIEVQILSRTRSGSVIICCHGRNIGVGAAIAQNILVTSLEQYSNSQSG